MTDLKIKLPTLNEEWIEENLGELLTDAIDFFESSEPQSFEYSIGALGFAQKLRTLSQQKREKFFLSDHELEAEEQSAKDVRTIFKTYNLWGKIICTIDDIQTYNQALEEIIFQIADNYARAWAKHMGVEAWEGYEGE